MSASTEAPFRRRVFYIPGFDPFPPRRYRELYRKEGAAQAAISGYSLTLCSSNIPGESPQATGAAPPRRFGWSVRSEMEGRVTEAEIEVLLWHDIVQRSMGQGLVSTYAQWARTIAVYVGSGAIFRLSRLRKGPTIAALYPVVLLGLYFLLAALAAWALWALLARLHPFAAPLSLAAIPLILHGFRRIDPKIFAFYLMHDYAHTASLAGAYPPELSARLDSFRTEIRAALSEPWDEVLVVGHSSGAHLGVTILADLLREAPPQAPLAFLTLGHVVPMVSFLPRAHRLRGDLRFLCARPELTWVDVTAPGDGCAYALCDPVGVTGVAPEGQLWPLILSAAFTQTLSPARWAELRWRFFRLHFQYLCAFDRPGLYDYFRITAGPMTLAQRFAGRAPSKSVISAPASGYRDVP